MEFLVAPERLDLPLDHLPDLGDIGGADRLAGRLRRGRREQREEDEEPQLRLPLTARTSLARSARTRRAYWAVVSRKAPL